MRILITTDTFPPIAGGSGWSTYELANGLRSRGHDLMLVQPYSDRPPSSFDGFDVGGFHVAAPAVPFVRNYFRNERLYVRFAEHLGRIIREHRVDLVHAQHELTGPASVRAARSARIPCICTVRDYWPICYWSDLMVEPVAGELCPACSSRGMTQCLQPRVGRAWPLTIPFIPYMRSNLSLKQRDLSDADAIVAVSRYTAAALRSRSPHLAERRIEVLPNGVDVARVRAHVRNAAPPLDEPYALFVGKLAHNKGIGALIDVVRRAALGLPLVVIGDGPERETLIEAAARTRTDLRIMRWLDRDDVFRWLGHAAFLVFPSNWPEPLSRVLIEASALCVPVAAMNTGGTPDVIVDGETGLLSSTAEELAEHVRRLASDAELRERLGTAAGKRAEAHFDIALVVDRFETLYRDVGQAFSARRGSGAA